MPNTISNLNTFSNTASQSSSRHWYITEKRVIVPIALPPEMVWTRLSEAFKNVIKKKTGFVGASVKFRGTIDGNSFDVRYSSFGKSSHSFPISGVVSPSPEGTQLSLTITDNNSSQFIFGALIAFAMAGFLAYNIGLTGVALAGATIVAGAAGGFFFGAANFFAGMWHRDVALNSTVETLTKIAYEQPYE